MAELIERAKEIRDETRLGRNTASRVGGLLVDILEQLEGDGTDDWFVERLKRHIDNDTVYWDDENRVIKARGGGVSDIFTVTVSINPSNIGQCTVTATGDVVGVVSAADKSSYTVNVSKGGDATVSIVPEDGYQVMRLNVDQVSQGAISEYTFENVDTNHTMYVWMEVKIDENPTEFLVRSDLPGMYYSSTQDALNAIKKDYPERLTKDVTITCVKPAKENRQSAGIWLANLRDWNLGSMYTLTIDGADKLIYDAISLGILSFIRVDNIVVKNIKMINFANRVSAYSPDEIEAIMFKGEKSTPTRNLYVQNCQFDGISTQNKQTDSTLTIGVKDCANITVNGCTFTGNNGITMDVKDCTCISLIKNICSMRVGVGHPSILALSQGNILFLEDNEFSGDIGENAISVYNVGYVFIRRNIFRDIMGKPISISEQELTNKIVIESNLFVNCLIKPFYGWVKEYMSIGITEELSMINNTFYMNSDWFEQNVLRGNTAKVFNLYNNIVVNATRNQDIPFSGFKLDNCKKFNSGSNIYQMILNDSGLVKYGSILSISNTDGDSDAVTINKKTSDLAYIQSLGYEADSALLDSGVKLIVKQEGEASYAITPEYDALYKADDTQVSDLDVEYKKTAPADNSRGCYNLVGTSIDEAADTTSGYAGYDIDNITDFSSSLQYSTFADSLLLFKHRTLNRKDLVKMSLIGTQHRYLILGKYGLISGNPELDINGEYQADELYTINVD